MDRLGPYRIEAEIGSGGMGTVYRAAVVEPAGGMPPGRVVALKVIHPHLVDQPAFVRRFLREADIGRKVCDEHVVRTLDAGESRLDGRSVLYIAMEFVEGRTLRRMLLDLGCVPELLLRELARQIASGLTAIHAQGIVHRDLKPENVLVTDSQRVCIMDLGVARLVDGTSGLTAPGHFAGSVHYAAPEQFRHEDAGPSADLYALGVVLYEMATGGNPFRRTDIATTIHAHLRETPSPVHHCRPAVSVFLSEVIATLLAKRPQDRFSTASMLARVLAEGERSRWWVGREKALLASQVVRPEIPVRRDTAVRGRDAELAAFAGWWKEATRGHGRVVVLEGEAGIGKTRFVDAAIERVGDVDAHVLYGAYLPTSGLGAFSDAIVERFGDATLDQALRPYLDAMPELVPGFAALVRHGDLPPGARRLEGDAPHTLMVQLVRALAREKPVLWVVEDLHFAPPESRALFVSLARAIAAAPVLLLVTTRPGRADDELARLTALPHCRRLALDRLSPREVIEVLREAFASATLADRLGGRIAFKSDGVPFFVFEMVRGLEEGGYLSRSDDGTYLETQEIGEIEVPSAVRDLVQARTRDLERPDRAILDVAAVQGFEFDPDLVARVLESKPILVLQALAEVERRSGLVRGAGRLLRFDHHQVQEVLYDALPQALRVAYHTALASALAEREGVGEKPVEEVDPRTCVFLVTHHLRGARPEDALPFLDRALDHLGYSYRTEAVVDRIERALAVPGLVRGERRTRLLLREAAGCGHLGRRAAQESALRRALALARKAGDPSLQAEVLTDLGWFRIRVSDYAGAEETLRQALSLAREAGGDSPLRAAALHLGVALYYLGRLDESERLLEEALAVARRGADRAGEAAALGSLGNVLRTRGRLDEALTNHRRHREIAREIGDPASEVTALGNIANVHTYRREYLSARDCYERALILARSIGDRYQEAMLLGNLGGSLLSQGGYAEALETYERALGMSREIGNRQGEANVLLNLGHVRRLLGDLDGAQDALEACRRIALEVGDPRLTAYVLLRLAKIHLVRGNLDRADHLAQEVTEHPEARRLGLFSPALAVRAEVAEEAGDTAGARSLFDEALALAEPDDPAARILRLREAGLSHATPETIRALVAARDGPVTAISEIEADFQAWRATHDIGYLEAAHQELRALAARVPAAYRDSVVENVPIHRAVLAAWRRREGTGS